jgi:sn-glycerol 3-phosphate transport system substrate-binding protein
MFDWTFYPNGEITLKKLFAPLLLLMVLSIGSMVSAQDDEIVTIDFVHIFSDDLRPLVIQEVIDAFEAENPHVKVNAYSTNADSDYNEVFLSAMDNADLGQAPSIVQVEEGLTRQAIDFGYFIPISDVASEEQLATLDDLLPTVLGFYEIEDELWGMPWNVSNPMLYYNRTAFEAAGLDPDVAPATFEDLLAACEALMTPDATFTSCINWPMSTWFVEQWFSMQGEEFVNNDNGRSARATEVYFNGDTMLDILKWWDQLDANGYYSYSGRIGDMNGEGIAFITQRTPIHINSSAGLSLFQNFSQFELGVAPLLVPHADANNGVTVGGGGLWIMADQTEAQIQASVDFIFFLTNTENDIQWHKGTGYVPIRQSSYDALVADGYYEENPFYLVAVEQLANSQSNIASSGAVIGPANEVRDHLLAAFQLMTDGAETSEEQLATLLENAKTRADAELADYNRDFE